MGDLVGIELIFHCLCKTGKGRERLRDMVKTSDGTAGVFTCHTIKQISQNGCTIITPELEGFRRPK